MSYQQSHVYTTEIKAMLYSFGDCKTPSNATAQRIETILKTQIRRFLSTCNDIRIIRGGKNINMEDIAFVIRKDPFKLQRLLDFVEFKNIKGKLESRIESTDSSELKDVEIPFPEKKALKYNWMTEVKGEDVFQLKRLAQIDKLTAEMSKEEYLYFAECRQSSFVYRKGKKFKEFLGFQNINDNIMDSLGYICFEMVYFLTDEIFKKRGVNQSKSNHITVEEVDETAYQISQDNKLFF
ncbi:Histone acetyltransferase PCAF/SAGA, subunit SUPT3H/SPT3 [Pseudoloma neurophilia]|uniref:Histone acetyltransferase PCAF/SAGA, subunit SUPT3H/SPT3 n=1 Tax=Pseudoloma neurophilia TaxID=146866 RepID=A0A0R0M141_9MICR|nr:Histone acetyltransferase PCAF/SAGA, subunit SUPT3H/SPT3 [Pseudoloma neurophilia]